MKPPETGPIYGVPLIETLPLGTNGGMLQRMPSRADLQDIRQMCERACAGYEVLLSHYRAKCERVAQLEEVSRILTRCPACHHTTIVNNDGRLLCTLLGCPDPTLIHRQGELT